MKATKVLFARLAQSKAAIVGASVAGLATVSNSAFAGDIDISAAVTSATADLKTAGGLIIGVVVAAVAFSWVRRVIK